MTGLVYTPCNCFVLLAEMLHTIFHSLYDVEVVTESALKDWRVRGPEQLGRGMALQSVKSFFEWLESAEIESDPETGT